MEYTILASSPDNDRFVCFHWRGDPEVAVERARREAPEFGYHDLTNFRWEERK